MGATYYNSFAMTLLVTHSLSKLPCGSDGPLLDPNANKKRDTDPDIAEVHCLKPEVLGCRWFCSSSVGSFRRLLVVAVSATASDQAVRAGDCKSDADPSASAPLLGQSTPADGKRQQAAAWVLIADETGHVLQHLKPPANELITCFNWNYRECCTRVAKPPRLPMPIGVHW